MAEGSRTGTQFGVYRLDGLIGQGGMGEVYRAYDTSKDRVVALKLLNPDLAQDPVYRERFKRESHAAARLQEPHVIPIHDWGEIDGVLYIDMRLVAGRDLREVLRTGGAMEPARAVAIVEQVAGALDAAHADGLIHRDIKPENIILADGDFAYLVDFGIAHSGDDAQLTIAGLAIGSYRYMAPERFDNATATRAADIYSLTCVLYECLTGVPPYPADTVTAAVKAHALSPAPIPSLHHPGVPAGFDRVIAQGLAKLPEQRFSSAGQLARAARTALDSTRVDLQKPVAGGSPPASLTTDPTYTGPGPQYSPTVQGGPAGFGSGSRYAGGPQYGAGAQYPPPPGYFPGPNPQGPGSGSDGSQAKTIAALVAVIAVAVIGLGALLLWFITSGNSDDESGEDTAIAVSTVTETARSTTEQTVTREQSGPPAGATPCPTVYGPAGTLSGSAIGTPVTSCAFAEEVRRAYGPIDASGQLRMIAATSPVTGVTYSMACTPAGNTVTCVGGENAVVHLF